MNKLLINTVWLSIYVIRKRASQTFGFKGTSNLTSLLALAITICILILPCGWYSVHLHSLSHHVDHDRLPSLRGMPLHGLPLHCCSYALSLLRMQVNRGCLKYSDNQMYILTEENNCYIFLIYILMLALVSLAGT